ncbi:MAG: hypothetical protein ACXW14_04075 [Burkholderiaceae bacterium]
MGRKFFVAPMWDVSGVTGAAPIWREIVEHLHASRPSRAPTAPTGTVQREVKFVPAVEPLRHEWFVAGTESTTHVTTISMPVAEAAPRLLAPAAGPVIAPDPDIKRPEPGEAEYKIRFREYRGVSFRFSRRQ